jgi:polar amino acid transport system substrate-binding protein
MNDNKASKRTALVVASGLLLVLVCSAASANSPNGKSNSYAENASGAAQKVIDSIKPNKKLAEKLPEKYRNSIKVGLTFRFPPMRWRHHDTKMGAEYDLARAIAKTLDTNLKTEIVSFDGLIPALKAHRIDMIIESMGDLPKRRKQVTFIDYYESYTALEVPKGNPQGIHGISDMCGHSIAIEQGVNGVEVAKDQSKKCKAEDKEPIDIMLYESSNDATLAVVSGRADATANDYPAALYESKTIKNGNALELANNPVGSGYVYGIAVRKNETRLQKALEATVQELMNSEAYKKIFTAYGVTKGLLKKTGINQGSALAKSQ